MMVAKQDFTNGAQSVGFPVMETERLILRALRDTDVEALRDIYGDVDVIRYMADQDKPVVDADELQWIIDWSRRMYANGSGVRWAIERKGEARLIGTCGFHLLDRHNQHAELGYDLAQAHWRQGIMSEALRPVLRYGFEHLKLHRIEANVTEGNTASVKTLLKAGFRPEGAWRERAYLRGQFYDLLQFGLLRGEFER
jgi:ribosomal-protein-alanine N-acetyltransferase